MDVKVEVFTLGKLSQVCSIMLDQIMLITMLQWRKISRGMAFQRQIKLRPFFHFRPSHVSLVPCHSHELGHNRRRLNGE